MGGRGRYEAVPYTAPVFGWYRLARVSGITSVAFGLPFGFGTADRESFHAVMIEIGDVDSTLFVRLKMCALRLCRFAASDMAELVEVCRTLGDVEEQQT